MCCVLWMEAQGTCSNLKSKAGMLLTLAAQPSKHPSKKKPVCALRFMIVLCMFAAMPNSFKSIFNHVEPQGIDSPVSVICQKTLQFRQAVSSYMTGQSKTVH